MKYQSRIMDPILSQMQGPLSPLYIQTQMSQTTIFNNSSYFNIPMRKSCTPNGDIYDCMDNMFVRVKLFNKKQNKHITLQKSQFQRL